MVVLEGSQGTFKSSSLKIIGGDLFTEAHESVTSKDFFQILEGKLIVEIAELAAKEVESFNIKPRIALLTYSNFGSADGDDAIKMRKALEILKVRALVLLIVRMSILEQPFIA